MRHTGHLEGRRWGFPPDAGQPCDNRTHLMDTYDFAGDSAAIETLPITPAPKADDPLMTADEAAERLGRPLATLKRWRAAGAGPAFLRLARNRVLYRVSALEDFRRASKRLPN